MLFYRVTNLGSLVGNRVVVACVATSFENVLNLSPEHASAHLQLGEIYRRRGQITQAVEAFQNVINLKPDYREAYLSLMLALRPALQAVSFSSTSAITPGWMPDRLNHP